MGAALMWIHRWIAHPRIRLPEEQLELYGMTNWAMALGLIAHVGFAPLFYLLGVKLLAAVNIVSIGTFGLALYFSRRGHFVASVLIGATEVAAHAWVATLWIGWMSGFHYHAILGLILVALYSPMKLKMRLGIACLVATSYVALVVVGSSHTGYVPLPASTATALGAMNAFVFLLCTTGMASYFTWTVGVNRMARRVAQSQARKHTTRLEDVNAELRRGEEALQRANEEAVASREAALEASRAKSDFLANMSHELRTPLNAIIGYSEMIAEDSEDDELTSDANKIHGAGRHLLTLINGILDLSKIEAGRMEVLCAPFDVAACVADVIDTVRPLAAGKGNELAVLVHEDLTEMTSDATKVRQIMLNLLSNACKFTENGKVSIEVSEVTPHGTDHLRIAVTDTGIGMTDDQIAKVFLQFTQAEKTTSRRYGGTGLGLAITKKFCELLGGDIDVASKRGDGSTFVVTLPMDASALSRVIQSPIDDD